MAVDKYGRLISNRDPKLGSEYGGVDRPIQPPPHNPQDVPRETLMMIYATNENSGAVFYKDGSTPVEDQPIPETKRIV
jgi:hypothetical protein